MSFWPKKQDFQDILINSLWTLLAGLIGSILIVIITFALNGILDIQGNFNNIQAGTKRNAIFPLILSFITLLGTTISSCLSYYILHKIEPEKYKNNSVILGQILFFQVFVYIFISPVYITMGLLDYQNVMIIYMIHILLLSFGLSLIMETLSNYRYILIGLYGSFSGLLVSSMIVMLLFQSMDEWIARLVILVTLLPLVNFTSVFFKQLFEMAYYGYYKLTSLDPIWDIFFQIELEEREALREEEQKNTL